MYSFGFRPKNAFTFSIFKKCRLQDSMIMKRSYKSKKCLHGLPGGSTAILRSKFDRSSKQHNLLTCKKTSEQVRPRRNFDIPLWAKVIVPTWEKSLGTAYLHQKLIEVTVFGILGVPVTLRWLFCDLPCWNLSVHPNYTGKWIRKGRDAKKERNRVSETID